MSKSISLLLGAGFSAPMGYPVGNDLNQKILKCNTEEFSFHTDGTLVVTMDGKKPDFGYKTSYDLEFEFCLELIKYFDKLKGGFDYERFFDFIKEDASEDPGVEALSKPFIENGRSVRQIVNSLDNIYPQLIGYYLVDGNKKAWYDDEGYITGSIFPGYTGILNYIKGLLPTYLINVHTLNHDLFFERLNMTEWIAGEICDGFEEFGSSYYGELTCKNRLYKVRLSRYTENYNKKIRLFKLHGSRDYGIYYKSTGSYATPETYVKTRFGIGVSNIFKEIINGNGSFEYDHSWFNYHPDFLTGTTSKIERYKEPLLYKNLFKYFRENLKAAESLVIIGYGGKDEEINDILIQNFDFKTKTSIIIDPYPSEKVQELRNKLNSKLVTESLERLKLE